MATAHPFEADRRVTAGVPMCRCGHPMGAALHHRPTTERPPVADPEEGPMLIFDMEVDVSDRPLATSRVRTHHVRIAVEDRPSLTGAEAEARFFAAAMGQARGDMVIAVRITAAEL